MAISRRRTRSRSSSEDIVVDMDPVEVKREPDEELRSVPLLPYVQKFKLLRHPMKKQPSSDVRDRTENRSFAPSRNVTCIREAVILLHRVKLYRNTKRMTRSTASARRRSKRKLNAVETRPSQKPSSSYKYQGVTLRPLRLQILLRPVQILRDHVLPIPEEVSLKRQSMQNKEVFIPVAKIDDTISQPNMLPANINYDDSFCSGNSPTCLQPEFLRSMDAELMPCIKIEPTNVEMEYDEDPCSSHRIQDECEIETDYKVPVTAQIVTVRLQRIDENILFYIKINNPEAVIPPVCPTMRQVVKRPPRRDAKTFNIEYL